MEPDPIDPELFSLVGSGINVLDTDLDLTFSTRSFANFSLKCSNSSLITNPGSIFLLKIFKVL